MKYVAFNKNNEVIAEGELDKPCRAIAIPNYKPISPKQTTSFTDDHIVCEYLGLCELGETLFFQEKDNGDD